MSKHWKRFAAVVVSLTMAFQFCVNDFYAYAETGTSQTDAVEETNTDQPQAPAEPTESTEPTPEAETDTTDPAQTPAEDTASGQESQDSDPAQGQTPVNEEEQPQEEAASTLKLEFKDEEGNTLKTVDPIALTGKTVGQPISLTEVGVDTNIEGYTLVDIKDKNHSTKDYNVNSVEFTLTKNVTELELIYETKSESDSENESQSDEEATENENTDKEQNSLKVKSEEPAPLTATIRYLNEENEVIHTETAQTINGGNLSANNPTKNYENQTYVFERATVSGVEIFYAESTSDGIYYTIEGDLSSGLGMKLGADQSITIDYKTIGNKVKVSYEVSGASDIEGNEVINFPSYAENGGSFSFQVNTARGYTANVTVDGEPVSVNGTTYTVNNVYENLVVKIEYNKERTVTFDLGVFNDSSYRYLYDNGDPRFNFISPSNGGILTEEIGTNGADFTFSFQTDNRSWVLDSLKINDTYLALPEGGSQGSNASTTLYGSDDEACTVTVTITDVSRSGQRTYEISVSGAKEDLTITEANLFGSASWQEVIPTASEGINFSKQNGEAGDTVLNRPHEIAGNTTQTFYFSLKEGYKNLSGTITGYSSSSSGLDDELKLQEQIILPTSYNVPKNITYRYYKGWFEGWHTVTVATITKTGENSYSITFNSYNSMDEQLSLLYLNLTCKKESYNIEYDVNGGTGSITDSQIYDVVNNSTAVITNQTPTPPEGKFFTGWTIKGDESGKKYLTGETLDFTDEAINKYIVASEQTDGKIVLVANYADELTSGTATDVSVNIWIQNKDGSYTLESKSTFKGIVGQTVVYRNIPEKEGYSYNKEKSTSEIIVDGSKSINLYYSLSFTGTVTLADWTYGDEAAEEVSSTTGGDYSDPTYYYKKADEGEDAYTQTKPTDAGEYVVKAVWAGTDNCEEIQDTDNFTIKKRVIKVSKNEEVYYNGNEQTMNITSDDIEEGNIAGKDILTVTASITGTDAGTYTTLDPGYSWNVKDEDGDKDLTANYDVKISGTLTIKKRGSEGDENAYTGTVTLADWTYGDEAAEEVSSTTGG
ncbi:FimV family protein, partial [Faecalicoccus acidiformans]|uniref:type IV pilus assembly protein FimV n=1 Tax=Faecalicoccus acidiformans TaxID=915173 RepID=UPI0023559999